MKKSRFFSALLCVGLIFVLLPTAAKAALWEVPTDLNPGDTFRWVFVTSTTTIATSSDIDYYNTFVNDAADTANLPISGVVGFSSIAEIDWKVIGSTSSDYAIDNIGTSPGGIFTPLGELLAHGTDHLFDTYNYPLINDPVITEYGDTTLNRYVWTGSTYWGFSPPSPLGDPYPTRGDLWWPAETTWIMGTHADATGLFPLYSISEELTVVPAPGALILAATGILSATAGLNRLHRKRQE